MNSNFSHTAAVPDLFVDVSHIVWLTGIEPTWPVSSYRGRCVPVINQQYYCTTSTSINLQEEVCNLWSRSSSCFCLADWNIVEKL